MKTVENIWPEIIDVWRSGQTQLPGVQRWKKYDKPKKGSKIRKQNSLQHSYSITVLGLLMSIKLSPWGELDSTLLLASLLLHDHGEGEIKKDTLYVDKTAQGDLDEYLAFQKRFKQLGKDEYRQLELAFLLQFAGKPYDHFPQSARSQMLDLMSGDNAINVHAFDAVERWDYLLYAIEQYQQLGNEKVLVQTLRHQIPHMDRLVKNLPGFKEVIWTSKIRRALIQFLKIYDGKWIEKKGEK